LEGFFVGKDFLMADETRAQDELRPIHFELDFAKYAEGSVLVSMGDTRVLCNVTLDTNLPPWLKRSSARHGWVTAEYSMLPRSTQQRTPRETLTPKGRTQEIQRLIGRSLRSIVNLDRLGERQIIADCDVLQADGGTRTAAINGAYVALALAVRRMEKRGSIPSGILRQPVAAVSVGIVDGKAMLDLDYKADVRAEVDMNVVMTGDGRFVELQGTAEKDPYPRAALNAMLLLAESGIKQILKEQERALAAARI
jgi:ribonuclease PH